MFANDVSHSPANEVGLLSLQVNVSENVITSVIDLLFSLDIMANREDYSSKMAIDLTQSRGIFI